MRAEDSHVDPLFGGVGECDVAGRRCRTRLIFYGTTEGQTRRIAERIARDIGARGFNARSSLPFSSRRLPEMEQLGDFLLKHINGIAAYRDHAVRLRCRRVDQHDHQSRATPRSGMRDEEMLLLKLKRATAHPIRSARGLMRFLTVQPLYSISEDR